MQALRNKLYNAINPNAKYPTTERILQFGEGNFLRSFVDEMVDRANNSAILDAGVVVVQPIPQGLVSVLNEQDGLYTLTLRGVVNGEPSVNQRVITSITRGINPYTDYDSYLELAHNPNLRIITSNTTEAGIVFTNEDSYDDRPQSSFPGKLTRFLHERYLAFDGAEEKGFILLPCELIDDNGDELFACVMKQANAWGLCDEFIRWVKNHNIFCNTLVDRICTGYPHKDAAEMTARLGYEDKLLDTAEPFGLWVIEGPSSIQKELPLDAAGCPVIFTDDVKPYKTRKVRMLNGAHTSLVPVAFLSGLDTVGECMADELVRAYMLRVLYDEIMPQINLPKDDLEAFAKAMIERFQNPYNIHMLLSISLNSISKFTARVLPTILEYNKNTGELPPCLTFALAALLCFYDGLKLENGKATITRDGKEYTILDDGEVLTFFATNSDVREVLAKISWWGRDLNAIPGLTVAVQKNIETIKNIGMAAALKLLMEG